LMTLPIPATGNQLAPYVAGGLITQGGANVITASVAGIGSVINAYTKGELQNDGEGGYTSGQKAMAAFQSGFLGARIGQQIPDQSSAAPSILTEQYRAQVDQSVQGLYNQFISPQNSDSQSQKKENKR